MLGYRCKCHRSSEMSIIKSRPMLQWVWHVKEPSLLNGHKCQAKVKISTPSLAMVMSPYERKILELDHKPQKCCYYLSLEKDMALRLNNFDFPSRCFVARLVEIGKVVLVKMKMWKFYRTGDHKSSFQLSDKMS